MIKDITEAILRINSNAEFSVHREENETVDDCTIIWKDGTEEISRADIKAEMDNV
tara:strand:- start:311 stop:475 length:165 start_codon:yes stop_codon:yes gene_type:complete